jgi:hypothetical protein
VTQIQTNSPQLFQPHVKTLPGAVNTTECAPPNCTSIIVSLSNDSGGTLLNLFLIGLLIPN